MSVSPLEWVLVVTQALRAIRGLVEIGEKMAAGEDVTDEELAAKKAETQQAIANWNAAAEHDRKEPE